MAKTLEEIMQEFEDVKKRVATIEDDIKGKTSKESKSALEKARKTADTKKRDYDLYYQLMNNPRTSAEEKNRQRSEFVKAKDEYDDAKRTLEEAEGKYTVTDQEKKELEQAKKEMDKILSVLMANPSINEYLAKGLEHKSSEQSKKIDEDIEKSNKKYEALAETLKSTKLPELKKALKDLAKAYKKYESISPSTSIREKTNIELAYVAQQDALKSILEKEGVLDDIVLIDADYDSIAQGKYEVPSKTAEETKLIKERDDFKDRMQKVIDKLREQKVVSTASPQIDPQLQGEIDANTQAIAGVEAELKSIADSSSRIDELEKKEKGSLTEKELEALKKSEERYANAIKALKDKGYVSKELIPELDDPTSEVSKLYDEYKASNKKFREALLKFQGEPTDENKNNLIDAQGFYKDACNRLLNKTGIGAKGWNMYFMAELKEASEKGEQVDEVFFDDTASIRAENVRKEYGLKIRNPEQKQAYKSFTERITALSDYQKKILDGEEFADNTRDKLLKEYDTSVGTLSSKLKGVTKESIFEFMKSGAIQKAVKNIPIIGSIIKNIEQKKFKNRKFSPDISYSEDIKLGLEELNESASNLKKRKIQLGPKKGNLTPAEEAELKGLREKASKKGEFEQRRQTLLTEKSGLDSRVAALPKQPSSEEISNAQYVDYILNNTQKQALTRSVQEEIEDMER